MLAFILAVLMLFLVPGPAVLLTISQTVKGGIKNGIVIGLGIALGDFGHTLAAVVGLSAILMTSALAFEIVKYLGAIYLVYLGITALTRKSKEIKKPTINDARLNVSFRQAFLIELLNPKTALFFLAFFPQFIKNNGVPVTTQFLMLGLIFVLMSIIYTTFLVFLTDTIGNKIFVKGNQISNWMGKVVGIVYLGLGLRLALQAQE